MSSRALHGIVESLKQGLDLDVNDLDRFEPGAFPRHDAHAGRWATQMLAHHVQHRLIGLTLLGLGFDRHGKTGSPSIEPHNPLSVGTGLDFNGENDGSVEGGRKAVGDPHALDGRSAVKGACRIFSKFRARISLFFYN